MTTQIDVPAEAETEVPTETETPAPKRIVAAEDTALHLHKLVRKVADEYAEMADPGDLAEIVFARITPDQYADALRLLLRSYVRTSLNAQRNHYFADEQDSDGQKQATPRSSYVTAMQGGAWRKELMERVKGADGWKLLRDCTVEDLRAAAAERMKLAAANAAHAEVYSNLARHLIALEATRVGDLSDDVLRGIFAPTEE
jgi:hypothetical protein